MASRFLIDRHPQFSSLDGDRWIPNEAPNGEDWMTKLL